MSWWQRLLAPGGARTAPLDGRLVVADVLSSGADRRRDRVLAIGAVVVEGGRLVLAERFARVLRQPTGVAPVLLHALTPAELAAGTPPPQALADWLEFLGSSPLVSFGAGPGWPLLDTALRRQRHRGLRPLRLDLARALPALLPQHGAQSLEGWLGRYGLTRDGEGALSRAVGAAQLLLVARTCAAQRGIDDLSALQRLIERQHKAMRRAAQRAPVEPVT